MPRLPKHCLERLDGAGLECFHFPNEHKGYPFGVMIYRVPAAGGNSIPEYDETVGDGLSRICLDAPTVHAYFADNKWFVESIEASLHHLGSFQNTWATPEQAVDDILDFYFGNPARMQTKESAYQNALARKRQFEAERARSLGDERQSL